MTKWFAAKYPGRCNCGCGEGFPRGTHICYSGAGGLLVMARHADRVPEPPKPKTKAAIRMERAEQAGQTSIKFEE